MQAMEMAESDVTQIPLFENVATEATETYQKYGIIEMPKEKTFGNLVISEGEKR